MLTKLPEPTYIESVMKTMTQYPFATLSLILIVGLISWGLTASKKK